MNNHDKHDECIPLSFISIHPQVSIDHGGSSDVQELNSAATTQRYSKASTYWYIHSSNLKSLPPNSLYVPKYHTTLETHVYDANGATILHQCFEHGKYDMVKWLIENYPKFSLRPYLLVRRNNILPYGGKNILHMAILAGNHDMAKWILTFYSRCSDQMLLALLTQRVCTNTKSGSYYSVDGGHYYGETPLQFAVCMDDVDMFDIVMSFTSQLEPILLEKGKQIRNMLFYPDCNGNNVFHLCVNRSLQKMYEHIKYFAVEMLQQELMIAVHASLLGSFDATITDPLFDDQKKADVVGVNYNGFYDPGEAQDLYKFSGHIHILEEVKLPSWTTRKKFFSVQVCSHVISLVKESCQKEKVEPSPELISSKVARVEELLGSGFRFDIAEIQDMAKGFFSEMKPCSYEDRISELKWLFRIWLYGAESGTKAGAIAQMFNSIFIFGLNNKYHSPVSLSAETGKALMLRCLLKENLCQNDQHYEFDLTGIEFCLQVYDKNSASYYDPPVPSTVTMYASISLISQSKEPMVNSLVEKLPELSAIVDYKWKRVGCGLFKDSRPFEMVLLAALLALNILIGMSNDQNGNNHTECDILQEQTMMSQIRLSYFDNNECSETDQSLTWIQWATPFVFWYCFVIATVSVLVIFGEFNGEFLGKLLPWVIRLFVDVVVSISAALLWVLFYGFQMLWLSFTVMFVVASSLIRVVVILILGWLVLTFTGTALPDNNDMQVALSQVTKSLRATKAELVRLFSCSEIFKPAKNVGITICPGAYDISFRCCVLLFFVAAWFQALFFNGGAFPSFWIKLASLATLADALLHLALMNEEFGCFMLTVMQIFSKDFVYFGYFFFGTVLAFALALSLVSVVENVKDANSNNFTFLVSSLIHVAVQDNGNLYEYPVASSLSVAFHVAVNIVMINILIAVMGTTYSWFNGDTKHAQAKLKCVRYLWMETFINCSQDSEILVKKYCYKRGVDGAYFFRMVEKLEDVNKRASISLSAYTSDKNPGSIDWESTQTQLCTSDHEKVPVLDGDKEILHSTFWVDEFGNHPRPDTFISFSDVNNFIWRPVDRHQIDYCRYVTRELEKLNLRLKISHSKRKILLVLHPQNDFCDRVPGIYRLHDLIIQMEKGAVPGESVEDKLLHGVLMINGCKAWFIDASERKGIIQSVRTQARAGKTVTMVEVLWEAEPYKPRSLRVEGFDGFESDMRHFRRLKNAYEKQLRVYLVGDDRSVAKRRFGRLANMDPNGIFYVRWDLSVPCYVPKDDLKCDFIPDRCYPFDVGCTVRFKSDRKPTPIQGLGPASNSSSSNTSSSSSSSSAASSAASSQPKTSFYIYGQGIVVGTTKSHVEVVWEAENSCGNLQIYGSFRDFTNIANLIKNNWMEYDEIVVSRDCHRCNHISHKSYWSNWNSGKIDEKVLEDYNIIKYLHVLTGSIKPVQEHFTGHCLNYIWELENQGRHQHIIWPTHCLVGSDLMQDAERVAMKRKFRHCADQQYRCINASDDLDMHVFNSTRGHEIVSEIRDALLYWKKRWREERKVKKDIRVVDTGQNISVEAYSIFKSEVENFSDPLSALNHHLLANLNQGDTEIHVCGEALSHVVRYSFEDLFDKTTQRATNLSLLINCKCYKYLNVMTRGGVGTSIVSSENGFFAGTAQFVHEIMDKGVQIQEVKDGKLHRIHSPTQVEDIMARHPVHRKEQQRALGDKTVKPSSDVAILAVKRDENVGSSFSIQHPESKEWNVMLDRELSRFSVSESYRNVQVDYYTSYWNLDELKKIETSRVGVIGITRDWLDMFGNEEADLNKFAEDNSSVVASWICFLVCKTVVAAREEGTTLKRRVMCYELGHDCVHNEDATFHSPRPRSSSKSNNVSQRQVTSEQRRPIRRSVTARSVSNDEHKAVAGADINSDTISPSLKLLLVAVVDENGDVGWGTETDDVGVAENSDNDGSIGSSDHNTTIGYSDNDASASSEHNTSENDTLNSCKDINASSRDKLPWSWRSSLQQNMDFRPTAALRQSISQLQDVLHMKIDGSIWRYMSGLTFHKIVTGIFEDTFRLAQNRYDTQLHVLTGKNTLERKNLRKRLFVASLQDIKGIVKHALEDVLCCPLVLDEDDKLVRFESLPPEDLVLLLCEGNEKLRKFIPTVTAKAIDGRWLLALANTPVDFQNIFENFDDNDRLFLKGFVDVWKNENVLISEDKEL